MRCIKSLPMCLLMLALAPLAGAQGDVVTPFDFGAVGDGVAADQAALQSTLNTGSVVDLAGGRFRITASVSVPAGGGIAGPGTIYHDFDISTPAAPSSADRAIFTNNDDVTFADFTIEKNYVNGSYGNGILADNVENLVIRNVEIFGYSARYGIHIVESTDFEVTGCYIHDFMMDTTADMIQDSPAGLRVTRSTKGVIAGNRVFNIETGPNGRASISPVRPAYGPQGYQSDNMTIMQSNEIVLESNICITSGEGIDMLLSDNCTLSNNIVSDQWALGFKMLGVRHTAVSGNVLTDCLQAMNFSYHSVVMLEASGNSVTGNMMRDIGSPGSFGLLGPDRVPSLDPYGIELETNGVPDTARHNVIADNMVADTQTVKTTSQGVVNGGGATNQLVNNVFTDSLVAPQP